MVHTVPSPGREGSAAQREAARRNGARSRGPVTAEGRARSSRNAFKHGLSAATWLVAPGEDPAAFEALRSALLAECRPAGPSAALLVERLAVTFWKLARCDRLEARLAAIEPRCPEGRLFPEPELPRVLSRLPELAILLRHQAQLDRQLLRLMRTLADRPAVPEDEFEDQNLQNEPEPASAAAEGRDETPSAAATGPNEHDDGAASLAASGPRLEQGSVAPDPRPEADQPASSAPPRPWMTGSEPGHDKKGTAGSGTGHDGKGASSGARAPYSGLSLSSSGEDPRIQASWMAGSVAGHDTKGMAGPKGGHDEEEEPDSPLFVMVGPRADHPVSSPLPSCRGTTSVPVVLGPRPERRSASPGPRSGAEDPALLDGRLGGRP